MANPRGQSRIHYVHRLSFSLRERLVGVFVLASLVFAIGLVLVNVEAVRWFEERVTYHIYLRNAQGISTKSVVKVSGIDVGRVSSLDISPENKIHISFFVYDRFRSLIRSDSKAALSKLSILGDASIEITAGSPGKAVLPEESVLFVEEPLTIDELIAELTPVMETAKQTFEKLSSIVGAIDPDHLASASQDLANTLNNLNGLGDQIAGGRGMLGRMLFDQGLEQQLQASLHSLAGALHKAELRIDELAPVVRNIETLTADSRDVVRSTQLLLERSTHLIEQSAKLVERMDNTIRTVDDDLQELPELIERMQTAVDAANRTLEGTHRIWPLSKAVPQAEGDPVIQARPLE